MRNIVFTAIGASIVLGCAVASAQGLPPGTVPPVYGSQAFGSNATDSRMAGMATVKSADTGSSAGKDAPRSMDRSAAHLN